MHLVEGDIDELFVFVLGKPALEAEGALLINDRAIEMEPHGRSLFFLSLTPSAMDEEQVKTTDKG